MTTVVFACVHNAGRSQMAAALFNALVNPANGRAISAGTNPGIRVHPTYHGYSLDDSRFAKLLKLAASANLFVQLVAELEELRTLVQRAEELTLQNARLLQERQRQLSGE